jgi:hypothetical protein
MEMASTISPLERTSDILSVRHIKTYSFYRESRSKCLHKPRPKVTPSNSPLWQLATRSQIHNRSAFDHYQNEKYADNKTNKRSIKLIKKSNTTFYIQQNPLKF